MRMKRIHVPTLDAAAIGRRVRELRKKRGWLLRDVAARSGLHVNVINHIELGIRPPSRDAAIALAVLFRRLLEWVYFGLKGNGRLWKLPDSADFVAGGAGGLTPPPAHPPAGPV